MKVSELILRLTEIEADYGDLEVYWQNDPRMTTIEIVSKSDFFAVVETGLDDPDLRVNLRSWNYDAIVMVVPKEDYQDV